MLCFCFWLVVQIFLESFPVSSSGHCVLFELYIKKHHYQINHYNDYFLHAGASSIMSIALLDHFVHGVTVVMIALFFFSRWWWLLIHLRRCYTIIAKIISLTFIADVMTFCLYLLFHYYLFSIPLAIGFSITALLLLSLYFVPDYPMVSKRQSLTWCKAVILGLVQGFCLLPGISRFAGTYVCARWMGISPHKSFEISWLFFWPLITVAFIHSAAIIVITTPQSLLLTPAVILLMVATGLVSLCALKGVARIAYAQKLWWFGFYMIVPIVVSCFV
ncbi:MAG: undecaprenyl-diphosphate phosphatase [Candidatus Babeliales bacterium]|nr:undecaprenyl-diphosphate phosphatase [Candidatus Babeliales bacterium]